MHAKKTVVMAAALALSATAWSQQPIVYPAKGQSPQQQNVDTADCQLWAKQNTGVDPVMVAQQMAYQPPPPQPQGEAGKGALKGAALGGIVGGIGGRGGEGAAAGAVVGMAAGRSQQRGRQQAYAQQQQSAQQQASSQIATFNRAFGACMEGRGYAIR